MSFSALRHAPLGALWLDRNARITEVNPAFERLTRLSPEAIQGRTLDSILAPLEGNADELTGVFEGAEPSAVALRELIEGAAMPKKLRVSAWMDGHSVYAAVEALGAHEEAAATLTAFAALVAHEIRNPLAGIGSALEVIADRMPAGGSEREVIAEIRNRLDRLNEQVDDLLLLVRPVHLQKRQCDLAALVERASRIVGVPSELGPAPVPLHADPELVLKGIVALLRYASSGEHAVDLRWQVDAGRASVTVSGGRLAAIQGAAADRWSLRGRHDGLELPVAARIAEAHDGRLEPDTSPLGVALRFELPLR